jgi:hypothetical protein
MVRQLTLDVLLPIALVALILALGTAPYWLLSWLLSAVR